MSRHRRVAVAAALTFSLFALAGSAMAASQLGVIEVVTLKFKPDVSVDAFRKADHAVEIDHVARQPGFISRESAPGADHSWVVIVHWRSTKDADASMKSFADAPAASTFMSLIEPNTMTMTRYGNGS